MLKRHLTLISILAFLLIISGLFLPFATAKPEVEYYAVIVGVSDYTPVGPGGPDLEYCDDDARDWYNTLTSYHHWKPDNIIMLIDSEATKANIQNAINTIAAKEDSDDLVLFIFSGHGTYDTDIAPIDETDGWDEYICPHDLNFIRDDELAEWLSILDSQKIVVVLDSCFSGGFMKGLRTLPGVPHKDLKDTLNADLAKSGYVVLMACDEDETCMESSDLENGVFTYYLIEGMTPTTSFPADVDRDNLVSAEEAFNYASPKATLFNPDQHGQIWDGVDGEAELTIPPRAPVGGEIYSPNKLVILAPYLALIGLTMIATVALKKKH
jgi:hypothetical protein